jgi:hypothetical protein
MRSTVVCLLVVGIMGSWTVSPSGWGQDLKTAEGEPKPPDPDRAERSRHARSLPDFDIWRRKAQLELEVLQAQVEAKKAEICRREAEHRARQLAPDLAILTKLEQPVTMSFPEATPLEEVLKHVKRSTRGPGDSGLPIYVDPAGLSKAEKTMQSPVTLDVEGVPLWTSLRLILKQLGLTYAVKDGLLTISAE